MTEGPTVTQVHPEIALQISRDLVAGKQQRIDKLEANISSLTASLDDANRTIARLSGEKAQLERVIATVKETVGGF